MEGTRHTLFAFAALTAMITFAGCSGVLPGGTASTPTPEEVSEPTPTAASTPTLTVEQTPSPTPTTPDPQTSTPTPSEVTSDYERFAELVAGELQRFGAKDESWVRDVAAGDSHSAILVRQPPEWSIKRTEMETVREVVRGLRLATSTDEETIENTNRLHRPEEFRIVVQNERGEITSRVFVDSELAIQYAETDVSLDEFAERLSATRNVEANVPLGENSTAYYLRYAEWRQIKDEQLDIINNTSVNNDTIDVDRVKVRPDENKIYYKYSPPSVSQSVVRKYTWLRTFWEAIRNVSDQRRVHRFPDQMRVYAAVPGNRDIETSIRTKYAFDFIEATDGTVDDENILENGAWNVYYPKANDTRYPDR